MNMPKANMHICILGYYKSLSKGRNNKLEDMR